MRRTPHTPGSPRWGRPSPGPGTSAAGADRWSRPRQLEPRPPAHRLSEPCPLEPRPLDPRASHPARPLPDVARGSPTLRPSFPGRPAILDHSPPSALTDALLDRLLRADDLAGFLRLLLPLLTARIPESPRELSSSLTLLRPRRTVLTVPVGTPAEALVEALDRVPDGPGTAALEERSPVRVGDARTDRRWPRRLATAAEHGVLSVLSLPLELGDEGQGVVSLYSPRAHDFPPHVVEVAGSLLAQVSTVLHLAVRMDRYRALAEDLRSAMSTRTAIDLAVGILMAQDRTDQEEAFALLKRVSHHRNVPLREIAVEIVERFSPRPPRTHFDA